MTDLSCGIVRVSLSRVEWLPSNVWVAMLVDEYLKSISLGELSFFKAENRYKLYEKSSIPFLNEYVEKLIFYMFIDSTLSIHCKVYLCNWGASESAINMLSILLWFPAY